MSATYFQPPPYPLWAFFKNEENAVNEVGWHLKTPDAMNGPSMLFDMAVACQGLADILLPIDEDSVYEHASASDPAKASSEEEASDPHLVPLTLNIFTIAETGERKSQVDRRFAAALFAHDEEREKKHEAGMAVYEVQYKIWDRIDGGLGRRLAALSTSNEPTDEVEAQIAAHAKKKPLAPRARHFVCNDISSSAIAEALDGVGESIALMSHEGATLLSGGALKDLARLNSIWDGSMLRVDRAKGKRRVGRQPRMSTNIMVQPSEWLDYLKRHGARARGIGYFARFLLAWPPSKQGSRLITGNEGGWKYLPVFRGRVKALLEEYDGRPAEGVPRRDVLRFTREARARWIILANYIEGLMRPFEGFSDVKDFAAKACQIIARVAGILHYFSGQTGGVTLDTLERAITIVEWHQGEFQRLFSPEHQVSEEMRDAEELRRYLHHWQQERHRAKQESRFVLRSKAQASGLRGKGRFAPALDVLRDNGVVKVEYLNQADLGRGMKPGNYIIFTPQMGYPLYV
jgi:hypothetical protein